MACPEHQLIAALFDGELDVAGAMEIEAHIAACLACQQRLSELAELRTAVRAQPYDRAPAALRAAIERLAVETAAPPRRNWLQRWWQKFAAPAYWAGAASGIAAAALGAFIWTAGADQDQLADMVASAHLRALLPGHLTDITASEPSSVAQWLREHSTIAPPVADPEHGIRLVGARSDYIYDRQAAAIVYREGRDVIDLFAWHDDGRMLPERAQEDGFNIRFWRRDGLIYCAVSRLPADALARFATLLTAARE